MIRISQRLVSRGTSQVPPPRPQAFFATSVSQSDDEIVQARRWLKNFDQLVIPRRHFDISFSRSSGPGGQHVNKYAESAMELFLGALD